MSNVPTPPVADGFVPSEADIEEVHAWYAEYERHVSEKNYEAMADMAMFPLNEVTDGSATSCTREEFVQQMKEMTAGNGEVSMRSRRTPHFVHSGLVFVINDATLSTGGQSYSLRYGDLLVKVDGVWKFQTMVQGGWGA